ncbi:MAG: hypothetical protein CTY15_01685 [Methylocystis sp.]|nr:MAG: hypothetical protein CTY15_01685 [Methylocystis sp.]
MLLFLCGLPMALGALFVVAVPVALAMLGTVLVRRRVPLSALVKNNEIAGFKFATVGVIYAVILAFAIVAVWDKFSEAELFVLQESGASATLYRVALSDEANGAATRAALDAYLTTVVEEEWPRMSNEKESKEAAKALDALYVAAIRFADSKPQAIGGEIMRELAAITQARRGRLHLAEGIVPPALWLMLVGGALITVGFTYFFGMDNLRPQLAMTAALAAIVFMGLFVIVSYDHPFTGEVAVESHPLAQVLKNFQR